MRITIDNLDGQGAVDYSPWIATPGGLSLERTLNQPSTCACLLDLNTSTLPVPTRRGRMVVTRDDGSVLFTGYVTTRPELRYLGVGEAGAMYAVHVRAVSDEWLLNRQRVTTVHTGLQVNAVRALGSMTNRMGVSGFTTSGSAAVGSVGVFVPEPSGNWSENAGALSSSVLASYRVLGGAVGVQGVGAVTHTLAEGDGSLELASLHVEGSRELANDVTVSGELEPAAYVTESFAGDGATTEFTLRRSPFRHSTSSAGATLLLDSFDEGLINAAVWNASDPGSHLSLTSAGLTLTGGNGLDGQTTLAAWDPVELGGVLVVELGTVQLHPGSDGVVGGLYSGDPTRPNCVAGYNVRQSNGSTILVPLVNGVETGSAFTVQEGHQYVLRMRVHSMEVQRIRQLFYAMAGGVVKSFGGGLVASPLDLVFDLQDAGASSNTPATVLYDGSMPSSVGSCSFVPLNSPQLIGSVGYCRVTQTGSAWLTKTAANGTRSTLLSGVAGEGVDCTVSAAGRVTFFPGRVPHPGELLTVRYRTSQRAVARLEDAASVAAEALGGVAGASRWLGRVVRPLARSSDDCESAAAALLAASTDESEGDKGNVLHGAGGRHLAWRSADGGSVAERR